MRLGVILLLCGLPACGGTVASKAAPAAAQVTTCPSTVTEAIGSACVTEGQSCFPEYSCGIAPATATCRCSGGKFACSDVLGTPLTPHATPQCPASLPSALACPASLAQARFTACGEPDASAMPGALYCYYPSPCASFPAYVMCECTQATQANGSVYFRYECPDLCTPTDGGSSPILEAASDATSRDAEAGSSPTDASTRDSPAESASDSAIDVTPEAAAGEAGLNDATSPDAAD